MLDSRRKDHRRFGDIQPSLLIGNWVIMGNEETNLQSVIFWGGPNEDKASGSMIWDHDLVINFSMAGDKPKMLINPERIVSILTGKTLDELEKTTVFDGAFEYKADRLKLELIQYPTCTRAKIWASQVSFEELSQRLKSAGAQQKKPNVEISIPDRPSLIPEDELKAFRFKYPDKQQQMDKEKAQKKGISLMISNVFALVAVAGVIAFILYQIFVTRHMPLPLPPEAWVAIKGDIAGFYLSAIEGTDIEKFGFRAGLVLLKFTEDVQALGVDSTCTFFVNEGDPISNRLVPQIVRDANGNEIYNLGARTTEFLEVEDYEQVNTNLFDIASYNNRKNAEGDWAQFGELGKGNAKRIIMRGGIAERNKMHLLALARGYAKLGDIAEGTPNFYNNLADNQSFVTAKYGLRSGNTVQIFGQIERTFTAKEGRNAEAKLLFSFRASYLRDR